MAWPGGRLAETLSRSFGALLIALAVAVFFVLIMLRVGWTRLFPSYYSPIPVDHKDPVMQEAIARARLELPRLRAALAEGRKQPFIKFPLKSAGGEIEHIWGIVHSLNDEAAQVSLVNEPVNKPEGKDPRFSVPLADIEDWTLIDGAGAIDGGYTHVALARRYKREKGFVPHAMRKQLARFAIST